jgi:APA family basic amino acid/polyamine antiporter
LLIEYALIVGVVAAGSSNYLQALITQITGWHLPATLQGAYDPAHPHGGHVFNLIAAIIALGIEWLQTISTEMGARFNTVVVTIKVIGVIVVVCVGAFYVDPANWTPFVPPAIHHAGSASNYGWSGVLAAASIVFFAVFGYDTLTTAAEESNNPQRDLPLAVVASLAVAMAMYLAISLILTGMVPYNACAGGGAAGHCQSMILSDPAPVSAVFEARGLHWVSGVINVAAVCGIISVVFAFMLGAARIGFALARDGLLPGWLAKPHPRHGTPHRPTWILGLFTAFVAGVLPIREIAELVNIGTLSAFILICASVLILRIRRPDLQRRFRTPFLYVLAPLGVVFSLFLIIGWPWAGHDGWRLIGGLPFVTIARFLVWMAIGLLIYFLYGIRHSKVAAPPRE